MSCVDWLVLTAANQAQALGYQTQLAQRQQLGILPKNTQWLVIPDPGNHRVGSGGSTLWVLYQLAQRLLKQNPNAKSLAQLFAKQRILIIHSGGDSRRLVAYTAQGKVFTPLPCSTLHGHPATLFDLLFSSLTHLPSPSSGHVLIAAGDVLLTFDPEDLNFNLPGIVGVAYPGPIERGSKHGVYVANDAGKVLDFLQKPSPQLAQSRNALDPAGRVLVDTGLISLDPQSSQLLLQTAGVRLSRHQLSISAGILDDVLHARLLNIDLYEQILMALPPHINQTAYLQQVAPKSSSPANQLIRQRLTQLHSALHQHPFHVNILPYCDFFHIGSSREMLSNVSSLSRTARAYSFQNFNRAVVADRASLEGVFLYNSILNTPSIRTGPNVLLEAVHTHHPVNLPGKNLVVGWPLTANQPLSLPPNWGLVCIPIQKNRWSVVLFGMEDDFKTTLQKQGTFGNHLLSQFLVQHHLNTTDLWPTSKNQPPAPQTLWNARLWTIGTLPQVLRQTLWLCQASSKKPSRWSSLKRYPVCDLLPLVDHDRLIQHRTNIQRLWEIYNLHERLQHQPDLCDQQIIANIHSPLEAGIALKQLTRMIASSSNSLDHSRWYWLAHTILQAYPSARKDAPPAADSLSSSSTTSKKSARSSKSSSPSVSSLPPSSSLSSAAFIAVAKAVSQQIIVPSKPKPAAILPDQVVWATTPVRLDFAGGWTDTPPICAQIGGTVLNAAITLNGQYPVQAIAKLTDQPQINLTSMDLGQRISFHQTSDLLDYQNPAHWAALPKAALILSGICPSSPSQSLQRWLQTLGGGLDITLFSAVPKGSGLGTSSILGAATLACLAKVIGQPLSNETLIAQTSILEQMMTTGGGWQDQVGGIAPGIKLARTQPGPIQSPSLHWTGFNLSLAASNQLLLYFTGQKRMAKNILQRVVSRYLARDPQALSIFHQLKADAEEMKHHLDRGDIPAFAQGVNNYWNLKKLLDPGSTNPPIQSLLKPIEKYLLGKVLPGAGGGGFIFMIAQDPSAAARIRQHLLKNPPNPHARFFDFAFDTKGLAVTTL